MNVERHIPTPLPREASAILEGYLEFDARCAVLDLVGRYGAEKARAMVLSILDDEAPQQARDAA